MFYTRRAIDMDADRRVPRENFFQSFVVAYPAKTEEGRFMDFLGRRGVGGSF